MQLSTANLNSNSAIYVDRLTTNNITVNGQSLSISGITTINASQISVGSNVSITQTSVIAPQIIIGGGVFGLGTTMGIVNVQFFTANGTWTKPATANNSDPRNQVFVMAWGGGGGGNSSNRGAGGGACFISQFPLSVFNTTEPVTVGLGGTAQVTGGNSVFGPIVAYGGGGGIGTAAGGGGGTLSVGNTTSGGLPLAGTISTFGGGTGTTGVGGNSVFGGGGGSGSGASGVSIYGGGGGASGAASGTSVFGGSGANSTVAATSPGGGGSGNANNINGARGEVRVWVIGPGPIQ